MAAAVWIIINQNHSRNDIVLIILGKWFMSMSVDIKTISIYYKFFLQVHLKIAIFTLNTVQLHNDELSEIWKSIEFVFMNFWQYYYWENMLKKLFADHIEFSNQIEFHSQWVYDHKIGFIDQLCRFLAPCSKILTPQELQIVSEKTVKVFQFSFSDDEILHHFLVYSALMIVASLFHSNPKNKTKPLNDLVASRAYRTWLIEIVT